MKLTYKIGLLDIMALLFALTVVVSAPAIARIFDQSSNLALVPVVIGNTCWMWFIAMRFRTDFVTVILASFVGLVSYQFLMQFVMIVWFLGQWRLS